MSFDLHKRSSSMGTLGRQTLKQLRTRKKEMLASNTLSMLKLIRTSYQKPFASVRPQINNEQQPEQQVRVVNKLKGTKQEFQMRCRKLCEQLCFHLEVFSKVYKENYRKKSVLVRFYGWDKDFQEILFYSHREELRNDITPENLYNKFNFSNKTFQTRNTYNKLRLFASEVLTNNRRQQQLQSKFMKIRLDSQLAKLDREVVDLAKDKQRGDLRAYLDEIGRTHDHMLNTKIKIHNKMESLDKIEQNTGKVKIKDYYGIEERDIDDVEKHFTRIRLEKRH